MSARWVFAGWAAFVAACWLVGTLLNDAGVDIMLEAPPLYGTWDIRLPIATIVPVALGAALVFALPLAAQRLSWRALLAAIAVAGLAWGLALTLVDGSHEIEEPLRVSTQYILAVDQVGSPGEFLSNFTEQIDDYPAHVRAHPPAMVLALAGLDQIGLGGTWAAAVFILLLAAMTAPAVLIAARELAGEEVARKAAPFLALTPAVLSIVTTADAAYMGIGAVACAALILAIERKSIPLAVLGGVFFGVLIFCNYGAVLLGTVPLAVAVHRRRVRELAIAAGTVLAIVGLVALAGFWWIDGLNTTRREYSQSVASTRPYAYFVFNNIAAFSIWLGPAVVLGLSRLRDRRLWLLVGGGMAAALLADVTGLSKAEVERIWLPFLPWVVLAAAALPRPRLALAAQAATTLVVGVGVYSLW